MPDARNKELLIMMGKLLAVFRKPGAAKDVTVQDRLAAALAPPPSVARVPAIFADHLPRPRVIFGFDATASRESAWKHTSVPLTDALLAALVGQLEVALAVHSGNRVTTFTRYTSDAGALRDIAASVRCVAGETRMLDIFEQGLVTENLKVIIYVGDAFEESIQRARKIATSLKARGTKTIILHDTNSLQCSGADVFAMMANITGGAVLPFDASALPKLKELMAAIAVLAVGGTEMLAAQKETMPAARLLLQHLKGEKS
jgi:hypothetical protein